MFIVERSVSSASRTLRACPRFCPTEAVARMLLRKALAMQEDPGQVIKALRLALDMSQADFARASGWASSTISSWERGRSRPSRLAFKTILAFAEERGVRYRAKTSAQAL